MRKNPVRSSLLALLAFVMIPALVLTMAPAPSAAQSTWSPRPLTATLRGSGATFPNPLYQTWIQVYKNVNSNVTISYQSVGSGQGIRDFIGYLVDFGGTDSVIPSQRLASEAPDALHVPMVMGAVVPTYNLPGVELRFTPEMLAGIYLGDIKRWNDPRIASANPGVRLPNTAITVVRRSDSSGTTSVWTDYLSKVSTEWRKEVGSGTTVKWPVGVGAPGNPGVASTVKNTVGAVGYVELIFALANKLPVPPVQNAAGKFITPSLESTSAAAAGVDLPDDLRVSITNSANPDAYPIAAFTWILIRQNTYTDAAKAQALTDFLYWALTDGTGAVTRLGYAPLPQEVRFKSIEQLRKVTVAGQRVFDGPVK